MKQIENRNQALTDEEHIRPCLCVQTPGLLEIAGRTCAGHLQRPLFREVRPSFLRYHHRIKGFGGGPLEHLLLKELLPVEDVDRKEQHQYATS